MITTNRPQDARDIAWTSMLNARTNVVYYGKIIEKLELMDVLLKISGGLAASGALVTALKDLGIGQWATPLLAGLAAIISVISPALKINERLKTSTVALTLYTVAHQGLEKLFIKNEVNEWTDNLNEAIDSYYQAERAEHEQVRTIDEKLMQIAQERVESEMGVKEKAA